MLAGALSELAIPGEKLPSVFADVRGKSVMDWIERHTAGAAFCRRAEVREEEQEGKLLVLNIYCTFFNFLVRKHFASLNLA